MELGTTVYIFQPRCKEDRKAYMYEGTIERIYKEVYKCSTEEVECIVAYDIAVEGHGMWYRIEPEAISITKKEAINKIRKELLKEEEEIDEKRKLIHFKIIDCDIELDTLDAEEINENN